MSILFYSNIILISSISTKIVNCQKSYGCMSARWSQKGARLRKRELLFECKSENLQKSPHPQVHTQPWQRQSRKQAKMMTQKHIQAKASMDKLCEKS